ncbi:hypothetical protein niasHT_022455 [Heterodera trifolii]|uniref:Uncharacterized protein n=1 Tax=Heterodera trifolii TaxID=157864 RepID=A0ABD2JGR9_9BILA
MFANRKMSEGHSVDGENAKKLERIAKECEKFDLNVCYLKKAEEIQFDDVKTLKFGCKWDIEAQKCVPIDETEKALKGEEKEKPRNLFGMAYRMI